MYKYLESFNQFDVLVSQGSGSRAATQKKTGSSAASSAKISKGDQDSSSSPAKEPRGSPLGASMEEGGFKTPPHRHPQAFKLNP